MLSLPPEFWAVPYRGEKYPGAPGVSGVADGANCQQFAYSVLRYFGFSIPDFRSSELWDDRVHTDMVDGPLRTFDLLLWNDRPEAWGAHVGLYIGDDRAMHLARSVGRPAVWTLAEFARRTEYRVFIGAKRPIGQHPGAT